MSPSRNHPINCGTATSAFTRTNATQTIAQRSADLEIITEYGPLNPDGTTIVAIGDVNYLRTQTDFSTSSKRININYLPEKFNPVRSTSSSNVDVLAPTVDPFVFSYQSDGNSSLMVEFVDGEIITKQASATTDEVIPDQFDSLVIGSLGRHVFDQTKALANNSTSPLLHYSIYSNYDQTNNIYTKSQSSWASALDFSGMMVNKAGSSGVTRVSAITPHHAIGASHYGPEVGDVIYFCDQNNQTVYRTVSAINDIGGITDCRIVRFSEALPSSVAKYKTLPSNWENYSPNSGVTRCSKWPIILTSHYRWDSEWPAQRSGRFAYVAQVYNLLQATSVNFILFQATNEFVNYNGIESGISGGDSGGPCFFIINGELVLVHCFLGANGGPFIPSFLSNINSALNTLGPSGQTIQTVDISGFTDFSS